MRNTTKLLLTLIFAVGAFWAINSQAADDQCTSSSGCAECAFDGDGGLACTFVNYDAWCDCTLGFQGAANTCASNGFCSYDTWSLGPSGGGYGPGGGSSCTILIGEWCPPSCVVCTTVFWF